MFLKTCDTEFVLKTTRLFLKQVENIKDLKEIVQQVQTLYDEIETDMITLYGLMTDRLMTFRLWRGFFYNDKIRHTVARLQSGMVLLEKRIERLVRVLQLPAYQHMGFSACEGVWKSRLEKRIDQDMEKT